MHPDGKLTYILISILMSDYCHSNVSSQTCVCDVFTVIWKELIRENGGEVISDLDLYDEDL